MDRRLQEMLDHHEITKVLNEYCHSCDRCDEEGMRNVYAEESWDDHGAIQASGADFPGIMISQIQATTDILAHLLGQSLINLRGDEAGVETYFLAVSHNVSKDGVTMCNQLGGRYIDTMQRENGGWRIKHRTVVRDWAISLPVEQDWTADAGLRDGQRSFDDPSCAILGRSQSTSPAV